MEKLRLTHIFLRQDESTMKRVAERIMGRTLKEGEVLVYLDGDEGNLDRTNLYVTNQLGLERLNKSIKDCVSSFMKEKQMEFNFFKGVFEKKTPARRKILVPSTKIEEKKEVGPLYLIKISLDIE